MKAIRWIFRAHARDGESRILTRGYRSARHPESLIDPSPVPIDEPVAYTIRTYPLDAWVAAGSRVRLVLRGLDDGRAGPVFTRPAPAGNGFTARVAVDGSSVLRLPIVARYDCLRVAQSTPPTSIVAGCEAASEPLS